MSVLGGYLVGGVDDHGVPTGEMDGCDPKLFDEATLAPKLRKYLLEPVTIRPRVTKRDGHTNLRLARFVERFGDECGEIVSRLFDEFPQSSVCSLVDQVKPLSDGDLKGSEVDVSALQLLVRDAQVVPGTF